jgi:hypothetical protein
MALHCNSHNKRTFGRGVFYSVHTHSTLYYTVLLEAVENVKQIWRYHQPANIGAELLNMETEESGMFGSVSKQ